MKVEGHYVGGGSGIGRGCKDISETLGETDASYICSPKFCSSSVNELISSSNTFPFPPSSKSLSLSGASYCSTHLSNPPNAPSSPANTGSDRDVEEVEDRGVFGASAAALTCEVDEQTEYETPGNRESSSDLD